MKRLLSAALALSLVAGPSAAVLAPAAASAQVVEKRVVQKPNGREVVTTTKVTPKGTKTVVKKRWAKGQRLPATYRSSRYYVDHRRYKLRAPPAGYRWVRVDNEFLLVAAATGLITEAIIASSY